MSDSLLEGRRQRVVAGLALLQSVIRSGEPWTETCYTATTGLLSEYDALQAFVTTIRSSHPMPERGLRDGCPVCEALVALGDTDAAA